MADISVTLGLDDSGYTSKLKAAENQAKSFSSASTNAFSSIQTGADKAGTAVSGLNSKFDALAKVLIGVGIAQFTVSLFEAANQLKDLSVSLDISIGRMMEMGAVASQSGSSLEGISKMLQRLEVSAGDAAAGSDKMRAAFEKVGESGSTINSSSFDLTFLRIARALADIQDPAERAAKANDLFGKSARGFDWAGYVSGIEKTYGTMDQFAESQKKAADISEQIKLQLMLLRSAFLELLEPVLKIVTPTGTMAEKMDQAKIAAGALAIGLAAIVGGQVVSGVAAIAGLFVSLAGALGLSTIATVAETQATVGLTAAELAFLRVKQAEAIARAESLAASIAEARAMLLTISTIQSETLATAELSAARRVLFIQTSQLAAAEAQAAGASAAVAAAGTGAATATVAGGTAATGAAVGWRALATSMAAALAPMAAMAAAAGAVVAVYQALFGENGITKGGSGANWISDMLGITDSTKQAAAATASVAPAIETNIKLTQAEEEAAKKAAQTKQWAATVAIQALDLEARKIRETTKAIVDAQQNAVNRISLQSNLVLGGADRRTEELTLAAYDAQFKKQQDILKINQDIAAQKAKLSDPNLSKDQVAGINAVIKAYEAQKNTLDGIAEKTVEIKNLELERAGILEMQQQITNAQNRAAEDMADLQKELDQQTMSTNQRRLDDVDKMIAAEQRAAVRAFEAAAGRKATSEELGNINKKVAATYEGLYDKTKKVISQSRDFATGWKKAMNQYVEDAGNAAKQAEQLFAKAFGGMEDMIVKFAKTGKFEWKEFVSSMLEELLRSQIKQLFANMMTGMSDSLGGLASAFGTAGATQASSGSGGGILDAIGSLFGSSNSSKGTPVYVTNMPGGAGGLSTPGTSTSGSSVLDILNNSVFKLPTSYPAGNNPDEASSGGVWDSIKSFGSGVLDVVSNIGSGISDFFGGWFANGGSLASGKFGIVGERGPEIVQGPATITPMGVGGTTNITYNINAVDAMSFKQMIAADPSFIYAVTMQGAKGMRA
jgi:lambda family phage tail tape measure protein